MAMLLGRMVFTLLFSTHYLFIGSKAQVAVTCSCDLTGNSCDANCCCDPDCTTNDVATFQCSSATYNQDSRLCVNQLVYVNNLPSSVVQQNNGVFCIINQRDTSLNSYTTPSIITDNSTFSSIQQEYGTFSYNVMIPTTTSPSFYVSGDTIDVRYTVTGLISTLRLPGPGPTGQCMDSNPASYMNDQTSSCGRQVTNVASACTSLSVLDPFTYFSQGVFQIAVLPVNSSNAASATYVNVTICNGSTLPTALSYDASTGTCSNVAISISYQITYGGTNGISAACVSFPSTGAVTSSFIQTFSITFVAAGTVLSNTQARSGNPGYVIGYPLRTAVGLSTNLTLDTSVLTLLSPNTDGSCPSVASQNQIKFKEDSRTGCLRSFNSSLSCSILDTTTRAILNEGTNVWVGAFGNTSTNDSVATNWIQVNDALDVTVGGVTVASGCTNVLTGINYEVVFANTGSLANPQPQILYVTYSGVTSSVNFECFGNGCSSTSTTQTLELTSSVTFTDASTSPASILRVRPTVDARLPADFFYPFSVGTA